MFRFRFNIFLEKSTSGVNNKFIKRKTMKRLTLGCHIWKNLFHSNSSRLIYTDTNVVIPGSVSLTRTVPSHIERPPYAENGFWFLKNHYTRPKDIEIKTAKQIQGMKDACKLAREMLDYASTFVERGVTTDGIDAMVHEEIITAGAYPSPLLYKGFPKSICTSVNNVACHGIPEDRELCEGDIINIDITIYYKGHHGDCSETYIVGETSADNEWLIETTRQCRDLAIGQCGPGVPFNTIGNTIANHAREWAFNIVTHFCGHGIGSYFHGPPEILHFENDDTRFMKPGMTFTVEPILSEGGSEIEILPDGWTAVTVDNTNTAQFEHTVLITDNGATILTQ